MYKTILQDASAEFIEKKSKFIGHIFKVETEAEAIEKIEEIKKTHYQATHNTHAYIIGEDAMIQRYSDDGEPSGTAGIPMIEVLKKEELRNVLVVVTRYFGGILLGSGGLVRAYSKAVTLAIDVAKRIVMKEYFLYSFCYDYTFHGKILNYLSNKDIKIIEENFTDKVNIKIYIDKDAKTLDELIDITNGQIDADNLAEVLLPTVDNKII